MVDTLQKWCNPEADSDPPSPPTAMFVWGKFRFTGQLKSVNATFNLFRRDGSPARAEVQVSMRERPEQVRGQNPTSGGPPGGARVGSSRATRCRRSPTASSATPTCGG